MAVVAVMVTITVLAKKYGLPLTALDLIITPLSIYLLFIALTKFGGAAEYVNIDSIIGLSTVKFVGLCLFGLVLILLSFFCVYLGYVEPLVLHTGVKGSSYGYTLMLLGVVGIVYSCFGLYLLVNTRFNAQ